jgi:hypothetical protein
LISSNILAYTRHNRYPDKHIVDDLKTIGDFNDFFSNNPDYYIHDCEIEMENGIIVRSHDDVEVSIELTGDNADKIIITRIFGQYGLDQNLIDILKGKPGHYLATDNKSNVIAEFENFDDYITKSYG